MSTSTSLKISIGFHFRKKWTKLNGVCKNRNFGAIWVLAQLEVLGAAILGISLME